MKIILKGQPLSTQSIYKYACRGRFPAMYMVKKGKDLKEYYQLQAKQQCKEMLRGDVEIDVRLYFKNRRSVDVDNFNKLWADSLEGIVYENDKQIKKMTVEKFIDIENPRIELLVRICYDEKI